MVSPWIGGTVGVEGRRRHRFAVELDHRRRPGREIDVDPKLRELRQRRCKHLLRARLRIDEGLRSLGRKLFTHHPLQVLGACDDLAGCHLTLAETNQDGGRVVERLGALQFFDRRSAIAAVGKLNPFETEVARERDVTRRRVLCERKGRDAERKGQRRGDRRQRTHALLLRKLETEIRGGLRSGPRGGRLGDALRRVQQKMLRSSSRAHPYFWAGFILSGQWTKLDARP